MEAKLLKRIAELADCSLEFKDEKILPGTAWLNGMPIDIEFKKGRCVLNSVGCFEGDFKRMSKGPHRGKGTFSTLIPFIKQALSETIIEGNAVPIALYLLPLSPVWKMRYNLQPADVSVKGCPYMIVL